MNNLVSYLDVKYFWKGSNLLFVAMISFIPYGVASKHKITKADYYSAKINRRLVLSVICEKFSLENFG